MSETDSSAGPTKRVQVWDLPVRLFHWSLAALFAVLWISGYNGTLGLHISAGALILTLLLFRLAWGVGGSPTARFSGFVRGPGAVFAYLRGGKASGVWSGIGHNPFGGWSVTVLIGLLLLQSVTGLFSTDDIATDGPLAWAVSSGTVKSLSSLHRQVGWLLLGLAGLHICAILYYRFGKGEDLITPMIGGDADLDTETAARAPKEPFASGQKAVGLLILAALVVYGGLAIWGK
ncbi:cytochrome b/b6 domain-containing protein [Magnetospirillum molischianum]|uniref:Cytochrome B561, bacterial n=1 Tax=Magnetospirillum molischianum DSM 120 TaxID=1150626 RepID=H8FW29_MAGML|nr:cytochrome b/b6 domain-containing protein [Magnetospirillum molischianum]CCG42567.1 Cytochrome B561, bacterial [Magnetospirillum molischianum DSM 120]